MEIVIDRRLSCVCVNFCAELRIFFTMKLSEMLG